jgi:hypothetical protein
MTRFNSKQRHGGHGDSGVDGFRGVFVSGFESAPPDSPDEPLI